MAKNDFLSHRHKLHNEYSDFFEKANKVIKRNTYSNDIKKSLLAQGRIETTNQFNKRVKNSEFKPKTPGIVAGLANQIFSQPVNRDLNDKRLEEWQKNVDGTNDLNIFMEKAFKDALSFGFVDVLVDLPNIDGDFANRREELEAGKVPYLVPYTADKRVAWKHDGLGMQWVVFKVTGGASGGYEEIDIHDSVEQYRYYDRHEWKVWTVTNGDYENAEMEGGNHDLGMVPVVTVAGSPEEIDRDFYKSFIFENLKYDIDAFNLESCFFNGTFIHGVPQLYFKSEGSKTPNDLQLNESSCLSLGVEEELGYLSVDTNGLKVVSDYIDKMKAESQRGTTSSGAGILDQNPSRESGVGLAYKFNEMAGKLLKGFTSGLERSELQILEIVSRYESGKTNFPIRKDVLDRDQNLINYPDKFDIFDTSQLIKDYKLVEPSITSESWHKAMKKRIAITMLGNADSKLKSEISSEIDDSQEISEDVLDFGEEEVEEPDEKQGE